MSFHHIFYWTDGNVSLWVLKLIHISKKGRWLQSYFYQWAWNLCIKTSKLPIKYWKTNHISHQYQLPRLRLPTALSEFGVWIWLPIENPWLHITRPKNTVTMRNIRNACHPSNAWRPCDLLSPHNMTTSWHGRTFWFLVACGKNQLSLVDSHCKRSKSEALIFSFMLALSWPSI